MWEELGVPVLGRGALSSRDVGPFGSVYFSPPKLAVASSEPNFWTHSLQIYCNRPGLKTETLHIYIYIFFFRLGWSCDHPAFNVILP